MEEEKNGSDKNVGSIENLIEELTKVRPDELSKDGLKLFEYINEIIDRNKELEESKSYNTAYSLGKAFENNKWTSKIKEKIEELNKLIIEAQKELGSDSKEYMIYVYQKDILQELLEKRK